MAEIRDVVQSDTDAVLRLTNAYHASVGRGAFSDDKVMRYIVDNPPDLFFKVIVDDADEPFAFMMGGLAPDIFGTDMLACDLGAYNDPEHKDAGALGLLMLKLFLKWAEEKGASQVVMGNVFSKNTQKLTALLRHMEFMPVGLWFAKELNNGREH